jgi:hypothetical protein
VDQHYSARGAVQFDDPVLGIDWGVDHGDINLSDKDMSPPQFVEWSNPFAKTCRVGFTGLRGIVAYRLRRCPTCAGGGIRSSMSTR